MNLVTLAGPGITYYADWYKPSCLDFAAKTIALDMKKIGPTQLKAGPHVSGRKIDADSGFMGRFAIWWGRIFFARGPIVFAAKFREVAPRRAAPRSMRVDARRADHAYHDMSIRCHAMHRNSRPGAAVRLF